MFSQVYNPLHNILLSALMAAIPIVVLLGAIGWLELKAHIAALLGLASAQIRKRNSTGSDKKSGKMVDARSIVVASTATRRYGHEGDILRFVFIDSIKLAILVGVLVMVMAHA